MERKIRIKNIGAVKDVDLNLNKINIFIGQQGSGKSTISKLISFCTWIEKDISISQSFKNYEEEDNFIDKLETFHKLKGYFKDDSEIEYNGIAIGFSFKNSSVKFMWNKGRYEYKKSKISYIPSERNMVTLPEIEKVDFPHNYLKSFLHDWFSARKHFTIQNKLPILDLGVDFHFSESTKENYVGNNKYDLVLSQASSGLQSAIPLLAMVNYLINNLYELDSNSSYEADEIKKKVSQTLVDEFLFLPIFKDKFDGDVKEKLKHLKILYEKLDSDDSEVFDHMGKYANVLENLFETHFTSLIIEEPEQNLFPSTQKDLVYNLFELINSNKQHTLTLTTHSPYILYAINNCILYSIVENKLDKEHVKCKKSKIDPSSISVYEIHNGCLIKIQDEMGLIGDNYFDKQMKEVMNDFYIMLNYL